MQDLDLAVIGNCAYAALIDRRARVVWACFPRFDGDPVFCSLLQPTGENAERGFYEVELADSGGAIKLKAWQDSPAFPQAEVLQRDDWVRAEGRWSCGEYGLDARDWHLRPLKDEEIEAVLAGTPAVREKQAADFSYIEATCAQLTDPRLRAVCGRFLEKFGGASRHGIGRGCEKAPRR